MGVFTAWRRWLISSKIKELREGYEKMPCMNMTYLGKHRIKNGVGACHNCHDVVKCKEVNWSNDVIARKIRFLYRLLRKLN